MPKNTPFVEGHVTDGRMAATGRVAAVINDPDNLRWGHNKVQETVLL